MERDNSRCVSVGTRELIYGVFIVLRFALMTPLTAEVASLATMNAWMKHLGLRPSAMACSSGQVQ